jgi:glycosyltransferase involved in cell wall biosynthesis
VGGVSRYCSALADLLGGFEGGAIQLDLAKTSSRDLGIQRSPVARLVKRVVGGPSFALRSAIARHGPRLVIDNHQSIWRDPKYSDQVHETVSCPYVLVIHDGAFPQVVRDGRITGARLEDALGWIAGAACMSEAIRAALADLAPGIRSARLSPLLAGAQEPDFDSWGEPLTGFFGRHDSVISTSGALAEHYGLRDVLGAFDVLRSRGKHVGLVLLLGSFADEEPSADALRESVDRWGAESVLALTDFPDGFGVIARSSVYVRSSLVDSFGLGLHEALQAGVPVVAARHETRPEGVTLYEPGDVEALAVALERALTPEAIAVGKALAPRFLELAERNRLETLEFLRSFV